MSVTVRPYRNRGWEVDILFRLPNGQRHRERCKAPVNSKSAAQRWGEDRERHLVQHGLPEPKKEVPTLKEFALRFMSEHANANRQKPSSIASKETILRVHLIPVLGEQRLDAITTAQVQQLKEHLAGRAAKTVNNVLTVLNVILKTAVKWAILERVSCEIQLVPVPITVSAFHDFDAYARLVAAAQKIGPQTHALVLLGGDAGLRCGEMAAIEWSDVDFTNRCLTIRQSDWKGQLTSTKSGRVRFIPMTKRLVEALQSARHLRSKRVICRKDGGSLRRQNIQKRVRRAARIAGVEHMGIHVLRHTFCSHLAMRGAPAKAIQELAGHAELGTTQRYMHLSASALTAAIRLLESPSVRSHHGDMVETEDNAERKANA
jgi:integrase